MKRFFGSIFIFALIIIAVLVVVMIVIVKHYNNPELAAQLFSFSPPIVLILSIFCAGSQLHYIKNEEQGDASMIIQIGGIVLILVTLQIMFVMHEYSHQVFFGDKYNDYFKSFHKHYPMYGTVIDKTNFSDDPKDKWFMVVEVNDERYQVHGKVVFELIAGYDQYPEINKFIVVPEPGTIEYYLKLKKKKEVWITHKRKYEHDGKIKVYEHKITPKDFAQYNL